MLCPSLDNYHPILSWVVITVISSNAVEYVKPFLMNNKNVKSYTTEQQVLRWHWIAQQPGVECDRQLLNWEGVARWKLPYGAYISWV